MTVGAWVYKPKTGPDIFFFILAILLSPCIVTSVWGQDSAPLSMTWQDVLAHNDYQKEQSLTNAYDHRVRVIEADLYYTEGKVIVAHDTTEIERALNLEKKYIIPLEKLVRKQGTPYPEKDLSLALMLDIKNQPEKVMKWILRLTKRYPDLFGSETRNYEVALIISGLRPPMNVWADLPNSVFVDGRLSDSIPEALRSKVFMVSSSFSDVVPGQWSQTHLTGSQINAVHETINGVHSQHLKIRFWGVPDNFYFWKLQSDLGADIIGCDHLYELAKHLSYPGK